MVSAQSQKFKFLGGENPYPQQKFEDVKQTPAQLEHDGIAANGKFIALPWDSQASVAVFPAHKFQRFDANVPLIKGHMGAICDLHFSPFHDNLLATASEDGKLKLWFLPDEGITGTTKEEDMELLGHSKKVMGF